MLLSPGLGGEEAIMSDPSKVRVNGPLEPHARGFHTELSRQGYTANSAGLQLFLMAHVSRWLVGKSLRADELSPTAVADFLRARRAAGYTQYLSSKALDPLLGYLRIIGVLAEPVPPVPTPLERLLQRFRDYLTSERGLALGTAWDYTHMVRPFLNRRATPTSVDLAGLTACNVIEFVVEQCRHRNRRSAKLMVTALRSLLRFLHYDGDVPQSLASAVPSVAAWRLAGLPRALEPAQVRRLLASCDRRTKTGRRDFAILTLLVRLGLRAGEVAALQLEDVDWRSGEIVIRGKANRSERLPLPVDVGQTLAGYLRCGRPLTGLSRAVFLRVRAPHRPLTVGGVTGVVKSAAHRSELPPMGAHRLRHTAATLMLRAGGSLTEIGQLLRHRQALTTAIYAKVDRNALRSIARPWPGGEV
jgi:site-specific recombinase XerD